MIPQSRNSVGSVDQGRVSERFGRTDHRNWMAASGFEVGGGLGWLSSVDLGLGWLSGVDLAGWVSSSGGG